MDKIVLKPANPLDIEPHELEDLAQSIRALRLDYEVEILPTEAMRGRGVTWWEVINVHVPWETVEHAAIGALVGESVRWMRKRFEKSPRPTKGGDNLWTKRREAEDCRAENT